tara:strand:+ start:506 stop:2809 length:2304 start_codon:yes stop_codon:yes gene_type:complete
MSTITTILNTDKVGDSRTVLNTNFSNLNADKLGINPALGTPTSGVATNLTGTAAGLTAGNVTTNANLTGHITSTGNGAILGSFSVSQLSTALSDATISGNNTGDQTTVSGTSGNTDALNSATTVVNVSSATAPTAGQVLKATSGTAATWQAEAGGTPEGTAILSTGETVGKVLQADGDDSSSWVTLPGGGDALVANPLSQFAATTSAQLAGVLSDETGSGAAVFGTSPAITTPTGIVKGDVGLGNVDNTSNVTERAATATLTNKTLDAATNSLTGTQASLTAGNVTTNANLTGGVTSVGNAATVVTNANLTGGVTSVGNAATVVTNANLTGDVTSVGNAATIAANAVTLAKMADMATASLLGRATAATGDPEVLSKTSALALLNVEDGADVTDATNVTAAGALMDSELTSIADVKALNQSVVSGATPTFTGTNISGTAASLTVGATTGVEAGADVTDATNVTAAGALMDSEVTNLAQVKAFSSADYATAAQGTTADAALPKTGGAMTGAITTNSTFDGRDVATDGTKLDGIEALADVTDATNVGAALTLTGDVTSSASMATTIAVDAVDIAMLSATGTASSTTFLRGDNTWDTPVVVGSYREVYINAGAMIPRTTSGAASGTAELATNDIMVDSMDFDTAAEEGVGFWVTLPSEWDASTVKLKAHWTAASGSGTVKWDFAARAYADSDAIDQALGTEQGSTDTLITANDMHISPATAALTIGGTAVAGEPIYFQVARDIATDTLGVDAQLIGVVLQYNESTTAPSIF